MRDHHSLVTRLMSRLLPRRGTQSPAAVAIPRPAAEDRLYVVGDVHGRLDLLEVMLRKIVADFAFRVSDGRRPKVILLGDIIDRGDQSRDVVERLRSSTGKGPLGEVTVLMGNHEAALLQFLSTPERGANWLRFGGMQTLASYGVSIPAGTLDATAYQNLAARLRAAMGNHLEFLRNLPLAYRSGDVLCVHAGVDPAHPDGRDEDNVLWGKARFPETGPVEGLRVVHGHYDAPEPVVTDGRICVDTGAYYTGQLTAVRLDQDTGIIVAET